MFFGIETGATLALALFIGFSAGVIKGVVGFAMPMVMVSGLATIASAEVAIAGMILPTLVTNLWQALRQGPRAAWASILRFRAFLLTGGAIMLLSAQLVPWLPGQLLLLFLGISITLFVLLQILGIRIRLSSGARSRAEPVFGAIAGFFGGLSGIWGPPTVAMLTAMNTEKAEQIRVQGVIYGLGSLVLVVAHLGSGVLRAETLPLTASLVPPALLGMALGFKLHDRFDQETFRKVTLFVLLFGGLNLVRRGLV
nr:sulfite exporter TauE/SafE family protein [Roseovarius faecimaris]